MGAGKSTWIKENGLEEYTLSADSIRLLFQSPIMTEHGTYTIDAKNDSQVWDFLFKVLERRMMRGEFTVIDATHAKQSAISRYKELASKYRYRVTVVDFSDVPLDKLIINNKSREEYKVVPVDSIYNAHTRMTTERVPSWVNLVKPSEYKESVEKFFSKMDFSHWKKIHHIGDIHGCNTALQEYLDGGLKEDELYIFVGDLLDRGLENAETLKFFVEIKDLKNVIILEGNHEHHIWCWSHDLPIVSKEFRERTQPQLEEAGIDKSAVRQLYRKLRQLAYYTYNEKTVVVTHGGISKIPDSFMYMATEEFIKGVGGYELDIDAAFFKNLNKEIVYKGGVGNKALATLTSLAETYQIHGHRNIFRVPVEASKNSFNLEGQVEKGGYLRAVTLTAEGFETHEVKNNVYAIRKGVVPDVAESTSVSDLLEYMRKHNQVAEAELGDNISSFNFTRKAFKDGFWDGINVKARGLFINTNTKEIVSRSYNKFFNVGEKSSTKISALADNLKFPVVAYSKPNGYLATVGYNSEKDELVFTSKSTVHGSHAQWFKEMFYEQFSAQDIAYIKKDMIRENISLVFEVLTQKDPHIIKYDEDKIILLDLVRREVEYSKLDYNAVVLFAHTYGVEYKQMVKKFDKWYDFYTWYQQISGIFTIEEEGYVIEDAVGFMTKIKLPYYVFWKQMRGVKHLIAKKHEHLLNTSGLHSPLHNMFFQWAKKQDREWMRSANIIEVREAYLRQLTILR